jgi:hypothetical protein
VLSITGAYMWWLRRQRVRAAARARGVSAEEEEESDAFAGAPVGWRPFAAAAPFLVAGYVLQAIVWDRGWGMTELLWQHWIVKPVCLLAVAFPVTLVAMALGRLVTKHTPLARVPSLAALASLLPVGGLYLLATALFN